MSLERIPMTREGYEKRKAELDRMENIVMVEITKRVAAAREMGDLSENAEYHAAREDQGQLQARIDQLKDELSRGFIIDPAAVTVNGVVVFGVRVQVKDVDSGDEEVFHLVGPGEEDYDNNKILITSPIGKGLLGKKVGETAEIQVPMGIVRFEIVGISTPE
jgi:transcription elongation factor GreA